MKLTKFLLSEIKVDKKMVERLIQFRLIWANKNEQRINFLSGPHIGVEPIRFLTREEEDFFETVLGLDRDYVEKEMHKLKGVHSDWDVGGNVYYLTCLTLMSIIKDSKDFKDKDKDKAILNLYHIVAYRFLTSFTVNGFSYDLNLDLAETVYETMSRRFLIKRLGSWNELLNYRAKDFQTKGIYNKRLVRADNEDITKLIAALRTRLMDHFSEQYGLIEDVKENKEKRLSSSKTKDGEDGEYVVDMENLNREYFNYAVAIVPIKSEFLDKDILDIVSNVYSRVNKKELVKVLEYMSDEYLNIKDIDKLIENILKANIDYIYGEKLYPPYDKRILQVMLFCKGLWSSSRVKDENVLSVKKELSGIVKKVTKKNTEWLITPIVITITMYIFVRTVIGYKK